MTRKYKYICMANCPELDIDGDIHCMTNNPETAFERYIDGCPCGNCPQWEVMK
jgi:hypothetical protein